MAIMAMVYLRFSRLKFLTADGFLWFWETTALVGLFLRIASDSLY